MMSLSFSKEFGNQLNSALGLKLVDAKFKADPSKFYFSAFEDIKCIELLSMRKVVNLIIDV